MLALSTIRYPAFRRLDLRHQQGPCCPAVNCLTPIGERASHSSRADNSSHIPFISHHTTMKSPAASAARLALSSARRTGLASSRRPVAPVLGSVRSWRALSGRAHMSTVVEDLGNTPSPPPPPPAAAPASVEAERAANAREILKRAVNATAPRNNWTKEEIAAIYYTPLMDLAFKAVSSTPARSITQPDVF